jgi:hypothetical protein
MALVEVTLTIQSDDPVPIALGGTVVTIQDEEQTMVFSTVTANVSGVCPSVALEEDTTYALLLSRAYTVFDVPVLLEVESGPAPLEYVVEGDLQIPLPPTDPLKCRIYGTVLHPNCDPYEDCSIVADNLFGNVALAGNALFGARSEAITDENGQFILDLPRGSTFRISVVGTTISARVQIPDAATCEITELLSLATDELPPIVPG